MRVYEIAKELKLSSAEVLDFLKKENVEVSSHMSILQDKDIALLKKYFSKVTSGDDSKKKNAKVEIAEAVKKNQKNSVNEVAENTKTDGLKNKKAVVKKSTINKTADNGEVLLKNISKKKTDGSVSEDVISVFGETDIAETPTGGNVAKENKKVSDIPDFFRRDTGAGLEIYDSEEDVIDTDQPLPVSLRRIAKVSSWLGDLAGVKRKRKKRYKTSKEKNVVQEDSGPVGDLDLSKPYSVIQLANLLKWTPQQAVGYFIKKGKFYSLNDTVPTSDLEVVGQELGLSIINQGITRNAALSLEGNSGNLDREKDSVKLEKRAPVVVIMGHVDHGKTSLIDSIRKTNLTTKEKGGITQTVRVYPVTVPSGDIVIIDTPGHEAFSLMRQVGAKITDIAVILVAADDGVMNQTIESIKIAKDMNALIIVAINKIDKPGVEANIEKIKQQLALHDVLVEEWGGTAVCVPISAKTGAGVADLLEMINLQADLMDLGASDKLPAKAFIVESFIEKGLGACAVVLLKQGKLKVGDNFAVANRSVGRVKAIVDFAGKNIRTLLPYQPAKIVGMPEVAKTGEFIEVLPSEQLEKIKSAAKAFVTSMHSGATEKSSGDALNVVLKADGYGTMDALINAINLLLSRDAKFRSMLNIVSSSIGNIYEKDVLTAIENKAVILGMNITLEKNAAELVRANNISVRLENIIYRLTEWVEEAIIAKLKAIKELKLVGRGYVKKVFDIKGRGVIAGCQITEGFFAEKTVMHCFRNGVKVGEGFVTSLQQNKKTVKEVPAGQDCGFISNGFSGWLENDKVVCFAEVSIY